MDNLEQALARRNELFAKGIITSSELASSFVHDVAAAQMADDVARLAANLPECVIPELMAFLLRIQRLNYKWQPLVIGEGPHVRFREDIRQQYELIHQRLSVASGQPGGEERRGSGRDGETADGSG